MGNVINAGFKYSTPDKAIGNPEDEPADLVTDPQTVISLLKKLILVGSLEAAAALGHRVDLLEQQMVALTERVDALESEAASDDIWQTNTTDAISQLNTRITVLEGERGSDVTLRFEYTLDSGIIAPPSSTQLRLNNVTQTSASLLWFHYNDADAAAQQNFLKLATAGATCLIQQKTDATKWLVFKLNANAVDKTTYFEMPVQWQSVGAAIPNGQRCIVLIYRS